MTKITTSSNVPRGALTSSAKSAFDPSSGIAAKTAAVANSAASALELRPLQMGSLPPGYSVSYRDAQGAGNFLAATPNTKLVVGGNYVFRVSYAGITVLEAAANNWGKQGSDAYSDPLSAAKTLFSARSAQNGNVAKDTKIAKLTVSANGSLSFVPATAPNASDLVGKPGGLRFRLNWDSTISRLDPAFKQRFKDAATRLTELLAPNIVVNVNVVSLANYGASSASFNPHKTSYAAVVEALTSSYARNHVMPQPQLPPGDPTLGLGVAVPTANAKALGLLPPESPGLDGVINIDPKASYTGAIWHELTHVLGRVSDSTIFDLFKYEETKVTSTTRYHLYRYEKIPPNNNTRNFYFSTDGGSTRMSDYMQYKNDDGDWNGPIDDMGWNLNNFTWADLNVMLALGYPLSGTARSNLQQRKNFTIDNPKVPNSTSFTFQDGLASYDTSLLLGMNLVGTKSPNIKVSMEYHEQDLGPEWKKFTPGMKIKNGAKIHIRLTIVAPGRRPIISEMSDAIEWGRPGVQYCKPNLVHQGDGLLNDPSPTFAFTFDPMHGETIAYVPPQPAVA